MPMPGPDDHPPPVQSGPAKAFIFGGAGAIVALVLLACERPVPRAEISRYGGLLPMW